MAEGLLGPPENLRKELDELRSSHAKQIEDLEQKSALLKERARRKILQLQKELDSLKSGGKETSGTNSEENIGETDQTLAALKASHKEEIDRLESSYQIKLAKVKAEMHSLLEKGSGASERTDDGVEELKTKNFTLSEQVKDFRIQIMALQQESSRLNGLLSQRNDERERNTKELEEQTLNLKSQLEQMTGDYETQKQTMAERESEILQLNSQMTIIKEQMQALNEDNERIKSEIALKSASYDSVKEDSSRTIARLEQELLQSRNELQNYKKRAQLALMSQENASEQEKKVNSLEQQLFKQGKINRELSDSLKESLDRREQLERKLEGSIAEANTYKEKSIELEQVNAEMMEELRTVRLDHGTINAQLNEATKEISQLKRQLDKSLAEIESKTASIEHGHKRIAELERLNQKNLQEIRDLQKLKKTQNAVALKINTTAAVSPSSAPQEADNNQLGLRNLLSSLSSPTTSVSPVNVSRVADNGHIETIREMSALLQESESTIEKMKEQERLLKEEIRKIDRDKQREQNANVEYLKNIILGFLETDNKESLLPVISQVLVLQPEEIERVKRALLQRTSFYGLW